MNWVLIVVMLLLIWEMMRGYRRGLLRTIYSLVSWVIVLVIVTLATPHIDAYLIEHTTLYDKIEAYCETSVRKNAQNKIEQQAADGSGEDPIAELGIKLPEGLKESDKLPEPIYTPSTKAEIGDHDENISYEQSIAHLEKYFPGKGAEYAEKLRDYTIALYKKCADYALSKGIIIADTKFEFGLDENGNIVIGDEMLTPDSSRFWPADGYEPGHGQPSFDKQFARDWLKANDGNHNWTLPQEIVDKTIEKYLQAYEMLTGKPLA